MRKKSLFILIFYTVCLISQTRNSVLSTGEWYKFSIDTTGVFKIDANFLSSLGININTVNPKNIKIYGNGGNLLPELASDFRYNDLQENSILVKGEDDNQFNGDDFILFYGVGPHSWNVDINNETASHIQNIYSDKAYYFINISDSPGKRITSTSNITNPATINITEFDDYIFYELEETNILAVGRLWFGENFSINSNQTFNLPFNNIVPGSNIKATVTAVTQSSITSNMNITVNGGNLPTINFPPVANSSSSGLARYGSSTGNVIGTNDNSINISYNNNGNPSANAFLDYIEIIGKKQLVVNNKQFAFRSFNQAKSTDVVSFEIQNSNNISALWDVSDPLNPKIISNENTSSANFSFKALGGNLNEYVILNENDYFSPERINNSSVRNQNLQALTDIEYLIITNNELMNQAQRLADYHQENSNLNTKVINVLDIYNEFSSGSPDIVGIRDFIKYLHDTSTRKLQYVCFFGDSSYDFKDRVTGNNNIVPTFHAEESFDLVASYVTDDFFVMIDDDDGRMRPTDNIDITSGRIPVSTTQEANDVINKILSYYETNAFGDWRNNIALIADDIDENSDRSLQSGLEEVADSIKKYKPILNINKIYADAFKQETSSGGERYPDVKNAITNAMEKGVLAFDYFGHGGEDGLALERILEIPQIQGFNNFNTLPLFITVTCEFSRFDNPLRDTAGEQLFLNPNGGAVSMITTTRDVFIFLGEAFNKELAKYVFDFDNSDDSIAANLIKTKNETSSNQRFFIYYFGDPAMKLAIPKPDVRITKVNDVDITQPVDALKALSRIKLEGIVSDNTGNPLTNFNGIVFTTIFDKPIDKTTLDNDGFGIVNTFDSQESKIFRGKSSVENGRFEFEFIVPKDIKITDGKGKISLYAQSENEDKAGVNFDVTVGGINENAPEDNTGPELRAFMNDESFIDGGTTNSSPNLIIKLADISGINTSITAVDHDIVAILDGNESEPFILNDFYETELNDFTKGEVNFKFRDLSVGIHTLKIKAWDTYNNSSEITLSFEVISDTELTLENVLNYPNPFTNYTEFWFNHNKPNEPLNVQVQIFTVSGKLIKTINQTVQTNGGLSRSITWNGLDDFGNKIGKGVYVYKIKVTSSVNNLTSEKYEKLVILQ
ncbi:type IX secretion system sortase PorU [Tenacibaculum jejuense]|uniref:Por secretion system protein PorU n=1 Tax=Tenacibaculum jejuense TaxID=584609 RepID=A0A238U7C9_9FLAO|nr:type IX secretion system sortase PorU [Tenacibaculum jejuense]SNR14916.1 Por secretion system protein PorU precursor [Tenacibaculum jejuense]